MLALCEVRMLISPHPLSQEKGLRLSSFLRSNGKEGLVSAQGPLHPPGSNTSRNFTEKSNSLKS